MTKTYKHIIWDWNGTLLNDTWLCVEVLNGLLSKRGRHPLSEDDYRQNFGFPVIHFYEYLGFDVDVDSFDRISKEFITAYETRWLEECALQTEAESTLARLSSLGFSHSVLSAAHQDALENGVQHFGIRDHFHELIGMDNIHAHGKVERGRAWISTLSQSPEELILVGDTLHDFEVAEAMGTDCLLLSHGHHTPERLATTGAPIVHSLSELVERLASHI